MIQVQQCCGARDTFPTRVEVTTADLRQMNPPSRVPTRIDATQGDPMHAYMFCLPQSKPVHEEPCCMSAENSVSSSEVVEAILSSLPTVGHGMGLGRD